MGKNIYILIDSDGDVLAAFYDHGIATMEAVDTGGSLVETMLYESVLKGNLLKEA